MQITDPKSFYRGWYEVAVPAQTVFRYGQVQVTDMEPEMQDWLLEHVGPSGRSTWVEACKQTSRRVIFRNKQKALLFKLTWS